MRINNTTDSGVIENVFVVVKVTDENGTPVPITTNPNDLTAKFYIRQSSRQNISDTDGTGSVNPKTTSTIDWILIPSPGSAGTSPLGKKYLVGATLQYRFGGENTVLVVAPDVITVKPLPLLTLDYFLTQNVWADDPLTPAIEPAEPFTLGVRVKNTGYSTAKALKIDSAQPKIVENNQGLLINFILTGSYVDDAPTQNTLLINFGDVLAGTNRMGRWVMQTSLAGKFTEFTARFSHSDELGGALTSILQATNAHFLIRDVRVDLPGRDAVRDFLAQDSDVVRVYESDGPDSIVTDRSAVATLVATAGGSGNTNATYRLTFPPTAGFAYARLPDPYNGAKALGAVLRSDAKQLLPENVWLSKTRNEQTKQWEYWVNFFDVNTSGVYDSQFQAPPVAAQPPVLQFVPDRTTKEKVPVSFIVEASSADGKPVTISAAPLPAGATFTLQPAQAGAPGLRRGVFDWTPASGTAGTYLITYTASDGVLSASRSASIRVDSGAASPGPGTPTIVAPLSGAQVTALRPALSVQTATAAQDPTTKVQFELYADEAMTQRVANGLVDRAGSAAVPAPTTWTVPDALADNTPYWWRARGFDGALYGNWATARFFVNTFNDPPDDFNLTSPAPNAQVDSVTPRLSWTNSVDKDGDAVTYIASVYFEADLVNVAAQSTDIAAGSGGSTGWTVPPGRLVNHHKYTWRVVAQDALGAQTPSLPRQFTVDTGNTAPTAPTIVSPPIGGQTATTSPALRVRPSVDADNDLITLVFEIDTVNTFDSPNKRTSGQIIQGESQIKSRFINWVATGLTENTHYWWRVKAQDGRAESGWSVGDFLVNAVNDPPPAPTIANPGSGAWSATQQPSLEANPVVDPEGDVVRYQFEVYRDAGLVQKVVDGTSDTTAFIVPQTLPDKTTYWWRVRALDVFDAASDWSPAAVLYVSTGPYQLPTIAVTSPATPTAPETVMVGGEVRRQTTLRWEGTDPNIEPTVSLYYSRSRNVNAKFGGTIVAGLRQPAGTQSGAYVWDVTALAAGTYYVHAEIHDAKGAGSAFAPGSVVIAPARQQGSMAVLAAPNLRASPGGQKAAFTVRLGSAPVDDVVVPLSTNAPRMAQLAPRSLTFTAQNWSVEQTVNVSAKAGCSTAAAHDVRVKVGRAISNDPDYIGIANADVTVMVVPAAATAGDAGVTGARDAGICGLQVVSQRKIGAGNQEYTREYTLKAQLTNSGHAASGATARLTNVPAGLQVVANTLVFGAVGAGDSALSSGSVVVRSRVPVTSETFEAGVGFRWDVTVER